MLKKSTSIALLLGVALTPLSPASAMLIPEQASVVYTVKIGDTINELFAQYLSPTADRAVILAFNDIRNPNLIPVGLQLRFPRSALLYRPASAKVTSLSCNEPIFLGNGSKPITVGASLSEGQSVRVPPECHVSVAIGDGSVIRLPSSATLKFTTLRQYALESVPDVRMDLQKGRVEVNVRKNRSKTTPFEVSSPKAVMGVRGTDFRVGFDAASDLTQVEVLSGMVAAKGGQDAQSQDVPKGFGMSIDRSGQSSGVEELLPAPAYLNAVKVSDRAPSVWINFEAISKAKAYLVESSPNANLTGERTSQTLTESRLPLAQLNESAMFYQLSAISPSGLQGQSRQYGFCQPAQPAGRCNVSFDVPLADGVPMTFELKAQKDSRLVTVVDPVRIAAKKGRFVLQGLPMGQYQWTLSHRIDKNTVVQNGVFDLLNITPKMP